ncbi:hypothetical protein MN116_002294 [Schistosoma mekongi]|uniref:Glycerol-3-phosphate dehydrogenase [NAD(+)] n=1 Tax=Schistosoma mekongi TaxID=38744 RepID=A0AAE1ZJF6_SCHME|nr:hypothetical protein MN116_002294 [Schistosoma mekongi]
MSLKRVSVIGSGNWGSTIAKIVGNNIIKFPEYVSEVRMWVFEEVIDGRKLTDIINTSHENVKYLPNIKLPENVIADPDIKSTAQDADILVIVMPHQFLNRTLAEMKPAVKPTSCAVSLMKGLALSDVHGIRLLSDCIRDKLNIPCAALMGANLANEVSEENYCEATIGIDDPKMGSELKKLFQTDYFRITVIKDEVGTELCGALKNIVAVATGIIEGLGFGNNTKAAVMRLGFVEMKNFIYQFFGDRHPQDGTFWESCGFADVITTCCSGRNRQMGIALATTNKTLAELEKERLKGQSAQGPLTAAEVYAMLEPKGLLEEYPIFTAVHKVCIRQLDPKNFIFCLANHPEHR